MPNITILLKNSGKEKKLPSYKKELAKVKKEYDKLIKKD